MHIICSTVWFENFLRKKEILIALDVNHTIITVKAQVVQVFISPESIGLIVHCRKTILDVNYIMAKLWTDNRCNKNYNDYVIIEMLASPLILYSFMPPFKKNNADTDFISCKSTARKIKLCCPQILVCLVFCSFEQVTIPH